MRVTLTDMSMRSEEGPRLTLVVENLHRAAGTFVYLVSIISAWAWIHCSNEHEVGRVDSASICSGYGDRLSSGAGAELRALIADTQVFRLEITPLDGPGLLRPDAGVSATDKRDLA